MNKKTIQIVTGMITPAFLVAAYFSAKIPDHIENSDYSHHDLRMLVMTNSSTTSIMVALATNGTSGAMSLGDEKYTIVNKQFTVI